MTTRTLAPFACRSCGQHLADTDGPTLYLGTCYFTIRVTLHCRHCANRTTWWPAPNGKEPVRWTRG